MVAETVPGSVRIGGVTKAALLAQLHQAGVRLNAIAQALFAHPGFSVSEVAEDVAVAEVAVGDLAHPRGATIAEVFAGARARGLLPCPLELAVHLRLQFMGQPEGYWGMPPSVHRAPPGSLTIASCPLLADDGMPMGFYLRRIQGVPWLRGYRSPADHAWSADDRFIFRRR